MKSVQKKKGIQYKEIEDSWNKTITYNKRKRGFIKKAMELSVLCGQQILVAMYNNQNNKLVIYQSEDDFSPAKVHNLLSSEMTKNNMYEEHTNADLDTTGNQKVQTFNLRNDHCNPAPKRSKLKKHWKIESKRAKTSEVDEKP